MATNRRLVAAAFCVVAGVGSPAWAATWTEQQELMPPANGTNGGFGYSVAVSGSTAVAGANGTKVGSHSQQGVAYVFVRTNGVWARRAELKASDGAANDHLGQAVALDGDTAVIGAKEAAYVFVRNSGVWTEQQKLTASDAATGDGFGTAVSISGDTVLIGARNKTVGSHTYEGAAYVFVRSGGVWTEQQKLTENGAHEDYFGWSVSVSGNTALIGALGKSNINAYQG